MSLTLTVTAKGQLIVPSKVLKHLGVREGDRVKVDLLPEGGVRLDSVKTSPMSSWFGRLEHVEEEPLSIEEMNEVIAAGWAGEE